MFVFLWITAALVYQCNAAYENCDYLQPMSAVDTYNIYDRNATGKFGPSASCRWQAVAPDDYVITLTCSNIAIPATTGCTQDRLTVSTTGDPSVRDGKVYCGTGSFNLVSFDNKITITLQSASNSAGGSYSCSIKATYKGCDCGWRKGSRIVGGTQAEPNEFIAMAALVDVTLSSKPSIYCGCTVVSRWYVVTAAHCLTGRNPGNTMVLLGEHDITTANDSIYTHVRNIEWMKSHEYYNQPAHRNDIGIIKLAQSIIYSPGVGPICLPYGLSNAALTGVQLVVAGWGTIDYGDVTSDVLKKTYLYGQSNETCNLYYSNTISDYQFCTYGDETDSCQNDSGGPLMYYDLNKGVWKYIGIVSYGKAGCATTNPAVNTRVDHYIDWIQTNANPTTFCTRYN